MMRLEDKQKPGLPPSPAPPRRSANPWKFSETARKAGPGPEPVSRQLLEELMRHAPADDAPAEAEVQPQANRTPARSGLWFVVIAGIAILIVLRIFLEARKDRDWVGMIGPLLVIAFVVHGWWRIRQRREAKKIRLG